MVAVGSPHRTVRLRVNELAPIRAIVGNKQAVVFVMKLRLVNESISLNNTFIQLLI